MAVTYSGHAQGWAWNNDHVEPPAGNLTDDVWNTAADGMLLCPVLRPAEFTVTAKPAGMVLQDDSEVTSNNITVGLYAYPLTGSVDGTTFQWDFSGTGLCAACLVYYVSGTANTVRIATFNVRAATAEEAAHPAPTITTTETGMIVTFCLQGAYPFPTPPTAYGSPLGNDNDSDGVGVAGASLADVAAGTIAPGDWTGTATDSAVTYTIELVDTPDPGSGIPATVNVPASAGAAEATAPNIAAAATIPAPAAASDAASATPTVTAAASIGIPAAAATAESTAPEPTAAATLVIPSAAALAEMANPTITVGGAVDMAIPAAEAMAAATPPAIAAASTIGLPAAAATASVTAPVVTAAATVAIPSASATASATAPVVTGAGEPSVDLSLVVGPSYTRPRFTVGRSAQGVTVGPTKQGVSVGPSRIQREKD